MNVLFVCTLNQARSVTAAKLCRGRRGLAVRSAGTSERAAHRVDAADLLWADRVVVFEDVHGRWLRDTFAGDLPPITVLGIPDDYRADDPALVAELREALDGLAWD